MKTYLGEPFLALISLAINILHLENEKPNIHKQLFHNFVPQVSSFRFLWEIRGSLF